MSLNGPRIHDQSMLPLTFQEESDLGSDLGSDPGAEIHEHSSVIAMLDAWSCNECESEIGLLFDVPLQCPYCFSENVYEVPEGFHGPEPTPRINPSRDTHQGTIAVYCDGSCLHASRGHGGWAFAYRDRNGNLVSDSGYAASVTNNQMELQGAIEAMKHFQVPSKIRIFCDSQYVVKGAMEWMQNWKQRGWVRKTGKSGKGPSPIKNLEYWRELDAEMQRHEAVSFQWIRGHNGNEMNEICDQLANEAAHRRR